MKAEVRDGCFQVDDTAMTYVIPVHRPHFSILESLGKQIMGLKFCVKTVQSNLEKLVSVTPLGIRRFPVISNPVQQRIVLGAVTTH